MSVVLFDQAAWVVLIKPTSWDRHGFKPWLEAAKKRLHHNVLAITLANKLARIAWSVLGCRLLVDKDISTLQRDFGIKVTEPICTNDGKDAPAPDFSELR